MTTTIARGALSALLALLLLGLAAGTSLATQPDPEHKVGLCHRTASDSNPYVYIKVDEAALSPGHLDNADPGHKPTAWKSDGVFRGVAHLDGDPKDDYLAQGAEDCEDTVTEETPSATPTPTPSPSEPPCDAILSAGLYDFATGELLADLGQTAEGANFDPQPFIPEEPGVYMVLVAESLPQQLTGASLDDQLECLALVFVAGVDELAPSEPEASAAPSQAAELPDTAVAEGFDLGTRGILVALGVFFVAMGVMALADRATRRR